jgi:hypothetical protein
MAVYFSMHLARIIYHLNFPTWIVNEIYVRNRRSIWELAGSKKISSNMGELVTLLAALAPLGPLVPTQQWKGYHESTP